MYFLNLISFIIEGAAPSSTEVVNNIAPITSGNTEADLKARHISVCAITYFR